nr:uncharacterized protein LOC127326470 isoform X2 [Lolium perenne]
MIVLTISSFSLGQTRQGSMSITIYEYARNLDSASNQRNDLTEIHMADIVSTTYDVLKEELSRDSDRHDGDRRFLRFQKGIEAGSPAIGEAIALGAAVDYLSQFGMLRIHEYEKEFGMYLYEIYPCETRYEFNEAK